MYHSGNKEEVLVVGRSWIRQVRTEMLTYTEHAILTPLASMYALPFAWVTKPVFTTEL